MNPQASASADERNRIFEQIRNCMDGRGQQSQQQQQQKKIPFRIPGLPRKNK